MVGEACVCVEELNLGKESYGSIKCMWQLFISLLKGDFLFICSMGRVKLKIKKLESVSNRQVTYSKRRNGILKKAKELSILCDIDIILLMFSPTGGATLFHGERRYFHVSNFCCQYLWILLDGKFRRSWPFSKVLICFYNTYLCRWLMYCKILNIKDDLPFLY